MTGGLTKPRHMGGEPGRPVVHGSPYIRGETVVDHDEIAAVVRALRERADELETLITTAPDKIIESFRETASRHTRDGQIAPIYADLDAGVVDALEKVRAKTADVIDALRNDADVMEQYSRRAREIDQAAADAARSVDI